LFVPPAHEPAYTRLDVDERRRRLLELGADLFGRHAYQELSMSRIAREAGISKALLYHYFPSKQEFLRAALGQVAADLEAVTATDPEQSPAEQLVASLDAFLGWIEAHELAYRKLMEGAGSVPEVGELVDAIREPTAQRILSGLAPAADARPPGGQARAAVRAWLWFMDGAILDWLEHRDFSRDELRGLLLGTLVGALQAAGSPQLD
jgi:AcrR family transcriptional regulator